MFDTLPRFPSVLALGLSLGHNKIESVQAIVDRLKSDQKYDISKVIRHLDLLNNPVMKKAKEDPKKKAVILSLLRSVNIISNIEYALMDVYDSDAEYELQIDHTGCCIVEGSRYRLLPLSVWPTLLERAYEKSDLICNSYSNNQSRTVLFVRFRTPSPNGPFPRLLRIPMTPSEYCCSYGSF